MKDGFTLIELLVVVTIIVILLALLAPALDKAIYQAELAVCAARLDGVATGFVSYATEHKRAYPIRQMAAIQTTPALVYLKNLTAGTVDDRPALVELFGSLDLVRCPMAGEIDLTTTQSSHVYMSYLLFYGWQYKDEPGGKRRLGDRFSYKGDELSVLGGDLDWYDNGPTSFSAHPDHDGVMSGHRPQDALIIDPAAPTGAATWAIWYAAAKRGLVDLNFNYEDGSVTRVDDVPWGQPKPDDERLTSVPIYGNGTDTSASGFVVSRR